MKLLWGRSVVLLLVLGLAQVARAGDLAYDDLLRRLPDSTNVIVAADVEGLRKMLGMEPGTPLLSSETNLPVTANRFIMGAHVDMSDRRHVWSIAVAELTRPIPIQDIAKAEGEAVDQVAGYSVVPSPRNAYFIDLGKGILAAGTPADRQQLKRWLAFQKNNRAPAFSPYLTQALKSTDALMLMAADLTDSLDPAAVHRGLNGSKVLAARKKIKYDVVGKTLVDIKGVTFTVQPGSPLAGELTVDFDCETAPVQNFAKALMLEILQHAGLYLADFEDWKVRLKERSIGIYGPLSLNGLRKIGTLIKTPAPAPESANMQSYQSLDPNQRAVASSQRYFKSVTKILADLKADKTRNVKALGGWYDQYAEQINKLPILDVDPALIQYASGMSENLRAMGASLKGISIQSGYLQQQKTEGQIYQAPSYTGNYNAWGPYGGYYGGWGANLANNAALYRSGTAGGVTTVSNYDQIYQQQDLLVRQGEAARIELWQRIDNDTAEMRRQMTLKYKTEF
jgi:hypothetical protein